MQHAHGGPRMSVSTSSTTKKLQPTTTSTSIWDDLDADDEMPNVDPT